MAFWFQEVIQCFLEEAPLLLEQLEQAVISKNFTKIAKAAHALKGSLANISAEEGAAHCHQLDLQAQSGDLSNCDQLIETIKRDVLATIKLASNLLPSRFKTASEQLHSN